MSDSYFVNRAGAVGPGAHAEHTTFTEINAGDNPQDLTELSLELSALCAALSPRATAPDHYIAVGEVAGAEKAAKGGDRAGALEHLKSAGAWVWENATKIGIGVATTAALHELGLK